MSWQSIQQVKAAIDKVISDGLIHDLKLNGATGGNVLAVLQHSEMLLDDSECYLEIGVFRGLSLLCTAAVRKDIHYMHLPFYN
ncbi:MAG: hypothetical protein H3C71_05780, partial [Flavobacteriales bacterium]|nr:hypothetical protein [Flavobacteriales bacterium]